MDAVFYNLNEVKELMGATGRGRTPAGQARTQAFLASSFFQVRLGALVTRPFLMALAATRT